MTAIKVIAETSDSVTISRSDWEALLDALEDAEDLAAVYARRAEEAVRGKDDVRRNYLTAEEAEQLWAGESPVKVWREKREMTQGALADATGVSVGVVNAIEVGEAPGSSEAVNTLAHALQIPAEWLQSDHAA